MEAAETNARAYPQRHAVDDHAVDRSRSWAKPQSNWKLTAKYFSRTIRDLADAHAGFAEILRQSGPLPWPIVEFSGLNSLTAAQFHLVWAWAENDVAKYCLGGSHR